jgi:hypothetical protein
MRPRRRIYYFYILLLTSRHLRFDEGLVQYDIGPSWAL